MNATLENTLDKTLSTSSNSFVPTTCGLLPEEPLLIEQSKEGRCGVDLPALKGLPTRTGVAERETVGLPQVSEQQAIRHFVRLSQRNYSIDSGFYPLGSCTMKHNPRQNEKFARFPGFALAHPLQPESTIQGALALMYQMQHCLATITGLPGVSLAPAAGAHGEMAGIMVIRSAHIAKGRARKTVLIPDSAHGTNPATAALCGYEIKTIASTKQGFVDVEAFKALLNDDVAAMMLTNPSTVGLFDPNILEISSKNTESNNENSVFTSENKLITPSLFTLCFNNSPIRALISFFEILPFPVIRDKSVRTVS